MTAVGQDGDHQMVPIAWAVVDKENKGNWRWFLSWLVQELELGDGSKLTIISYMQKVTVMSDLTCFNSEFTYLKLVFL